MIRISRVGIVAHRHCVVRIQQIYSLYTANIQVVQTGECQVLEENHENGSETGPYGSVRADIHTGWIPQALGSLWDASRALKPSGNKKIQVFRVFPYFTVFSYIFLSSLNSNRPAYILMSSFLTSAPVAQGRWDQDGHSSVPHRAGP